MHPCIGDVVAVRLHEVGVVLDVGVDRVQQTLLVVVVAVRPTLGQRAAESGVEGQPEAVTNLFDLPLKNAREQFERIYLEHHLRQFGGSVAKIAGPVGMDRTNLYRKLRSLELDPKQYGDDE